MSNDTIKQESISDLTLGVPKLSVHPLETLALASVARSARSWPAKVNRTSAVLKSNELHIHGTMRQDGRLSTEACLVVPRILLLRISAVSCGDKSMVKVVPKGLFTKSCIGRENQRKLLCCTADSLNVDKMPKSNTGGRNQFAHRANCEPSMFADKLRSPLVSPENDNKN
jgi:hypothetical protein